ncbi:MAG: hypothetical protein ABS944_10425 [Solibacillus sp.]|uniref:hypothetical protein n=1 Tax=unclassified Solibacillus TaxID=2637870 RepID=UPI0030FA414C
MKIKSILIPLLVLILFGCNYNDENTISHEKQNNKQLNKMQIVSSDEDDFTFTITSDKKIYSKGEKVDIEANLLYNGKSSEVIVRGGGNLITSEVLNELGEEISPRYSREDIALPYTFAKGQPVILNTTDIDTTHLDLGKVTVNATVEFYLNQKDYKLNNELVFTIK